MTITNPAELETILIKNLKPVDRIVFALVNTIEKLMEDFQPYFDRNPTKAREKVGMYVLDVLGHELDKRLKYRPATGIITGHTFIALSKDVYLDPKSPYWTKYQDQHLNEFTDVEDDDAVNAAEWLFKTYIGPIWKLVQPFLEGQEHVIHTLALVGNTLVLSRYIDFRIAYFNQFCAGKIYGTAP